MFTIPILKVFSNLLKLKKVLVVQTMKIDGSNWD